MVLSVCDFPLAVHTAVQIGDAVSIEIQPDADGNHIGYHTDDLSEPHGECSTKHGAAHGQGSGFAGDDAVIEIGPELNASANAVDNGGDRDRRQSCTKTIEVLVINDRRLYQARGSNTESFSSQIFSAVQGIYQSKLLSPTHACSTFLTDHSVRAGGVGPLQTPEHPRTRTASRRYC